jgi:hypothetical protein
MYIHFISVRICIGGHPTRKVGHPTRKDGTTDREEPFGCIRTVRISCICPQGSSSLLRPFHTLINSHLSKYFIAYSPIIPNAYSQTCGGHNFAVERGVHWTKRYPKHWVMAGWPILMCVHESVFIHVCYITQLSPIYGYFAIISSKYRPFRLVLAIVVGILRTTLQRRYSHPLSHRHTASPTSFILTTFDFRLSTFCFRLSTFGFRPLTILFTFDY